jgi:hypothetical protein
MRQFFFNKRPLIFLVFLGLLLSSACKNDNPIGKWEKGKIPYFLKGNFSDQDIAYIEKAMKKWEDTADIDFRKVSPRAGAYRIEKVDDDKWQSSIGENNSVCYMIVGSGQDPLEHIIHELGHGIGLLHEHQRPDRDNFVNINYGNILSSFHFNFDKKDNPLITESDYNYDFNSVMHYGETAFSSNGGLTIEPINNSEVLKRELISAIDAAKVRAIYGPPSN